MNDSKQYFLDTNVFIRFFSCEETWSYAECKHILDLAEIGNFRPVVSELVLAEVNWVLTSYYNQPKSVVCDALQSIDRLSGISVFPSGRPAASLELYRTHNIKYIDATIASIPQILSGAIPVISYDTDFEKLPVRWFTPGRFLEKLGVDR